jgi:predicted transcriptional regulator
MEEHVFCIRRNSRSNMTKQKRGHLRIISNVLSFTMNGSLKTELMRKANLSYAQLKSYIPMLIRLKLLAASKSEKTTVYETIEKGMNFFERSREDKLLKSSPKEHVKKTDDLPKPSCFGK